MQRKSYSRSEFIRNSAKAGFGSFLSMSAIAGCESSKGRPENDDIRTIAGMSLEQLRKRYRSDLMDQFIPNMDRYVIDHKYGGFMTTVDIRTGKQLSTDKRAWYEGRGMWVYSFLYNNIKQDPSFLEVARKSKDFILKLQPSDGSFWNTSFSREGKPLSGPGDIFGNLYIAEGLAEYAKASGEGQYFDRAKEITLNALSRYDRPGYIYSRAKNIEGPRLLNHWMVFLHLATQMLRQESDPKIKQLADRCIDAIMNHHLNSKYNLLNGVLTHNLGLPNNKWAQFASVGIGVQTLWMVLYEAVRREDGGLFYKAQKLFKRHVRVAYDGVYGGHFNSLEHVDKYIWKLNKAFSLQAEVLIGTLFLIEHGDLWSRQCFAETEIYVQDKFARSDYKFWISSGNRKVSEYQTNRVGHYHFPRHLMLNLLAFDRMIERRDKAFGMVVR